MATSRGNAGVVLIGASTVASVRSFTRNKQAQRIETTVLGQTNRSYINDAAEIGGTITCLFDPADTNGQEAMDSALDAGTALTLVLRPQGTGSGLPSETGSVTILGAGLPSVGFGEMIERTFEWTSSDGTWTRSTQ